MAAFVWGKNGEKLTPEDVERQRLASQMMYKQGADFSPAGHWSEALGRAFNGWASGRINKLAGQGEKEGLAGADERIAAILAGQGGGGGGYTASTSGGGSAPSGSWTPAAPGPSPVDVATQGVTGGASFAGLPRADTGIMQGGGDFGSVGMTPQEMLIEGAKRRGLDPIDVATAISYETGGRFDPLIKGPTTQWGTHEGLIQFGDPQGQEHGAVFDQGPDAAWRSQLNPENGAVWSYLDSVGVKPGMGLPEIYSGINAGAVGRMGASDANNGGAPGTVADKVASMGPHRDKAAAFLGGTWTPDPNAASVTASTSGAPAIPGGSGGMDIASLLALQSDPWVAKKYGGVVDALMGQQFSRQNALWEQEQRMADPMYQAQLEMAQLELQQAQNPSAPAPIEVGGVLLDPTTFQPIFDSRTSGGAEGFTLSPGQVRYDAAGNEIAAVDAPPPDPTVPTTKNVKLPDGSDALVQWNPTTQVWDAAPIPQGGTTGAGAPTAKLTEAQAKTTLFETLQTETAPVLAQIESIWDPTNLGDAVARSTPIAGNFFQTEEGQMYSAASSAWAEGALRISTGAAATEPEIQRIQKTYFAQPGDTPAVVAFKKGMREMYSRAIDASLGQDNSGKGALALPDQFAKAYSAQNPPPAALPVDGGSDVPPPPGVDPADWQFMTPEEKALFK